MNISSSPCFYEKSWERVAESYFTNNHPRQNYSNSAIYCWREYPAFKQYKWVSNQ